VGIFRGQAGFARRYDLSFDLCARATPLPSVFQSHMIRIRSFHARVLPGIPTDARQPTLRHPLPLPPSLVYVSRTNRSCLASGYWSSLFFPSLSLRLTTRPLSVFILPGDADPLSSLEFGATTATSNTMVRSEVSRCRGVSQSLT
jgi:hypothetical protein